MTLLKGRDTIVPLKTGSLREVPYKTSIGITSVKGGALQNCISQSESATRSQLHPRGSPQPCSRMVGGRVHQLHYAFGRQRPTRSFPVLTMELRLTDRKITGTERTKRSTFITGFHLQRSRIALNIYAEPSPFGWH